MPFYAQRYLAGEGYRLCSTHISLGYHPETHDELMLPDKDRTMGVHLVGRSGSGKSSGIKGHVHQDAMARRAIIMLDPHDDLVDESVAELPQSCIAYTRVLDMRDEQFPFGVNLFDMAGKLTTEEERTQAIDRILHIFDVLWPEVLSQQHLPVMLRCAITAFLDNTGLTLVDMIDFFRDDAFRAQVLSKVKDKGVREFFEHEYDQLSPDERRRRVQPLMNRLQSLFVGRGLVRNTLGQRKSSIDFRKAIENRELIFIKLPVTTMEQDARLIGTILMAQITAAIFSFVDTPPERRPGVSLYVDEFQNFVTPDVRRLITEGRKYGVRLTIAHQYLGQLPEYLQKPTMGVQTHIVFRSNPEDAKTLGALFPPRPAEVSPNDADPHATKYLLEYGADDTHVREFVDTYLRPLQSQRHGGKVPIERQYFTVDVKQTLIWGAQAGMGKRSYEEPDPTPYLDNLLREVMKQQNPLLDIPYKAIAGFANCNGGFYGAFGSITSNDLTGEVLFPAHLANQTAQGYVWLRKPENEKERLYHCIFSMRMVMMYLAAHPLLKSGKTATIDYAQILIQLPVRAALVKSGDDAGVIYTNNTPKALTGETLSARRYFIQEQTRQRYCHPRDQIEALIDQTTPPDEFTLKRWEEVESDDGTSNQTTTQSSPPHHPDLRHPAAGNTATDGGAVSATTADGGAADAAPLQAGDAHDGQGAAQDTYDVWVRAIRRDPEP